MTSVEEKRTEKDRLLINIVPSERQIAHQKLEFYAFVHFTVNTYTGKEWGDGTESPEIFDPVDFDADQWTDALVNAGMKGLILTCKHHDGFCLWPSRYTEHSIANSPYKEGKGDIVKAISESCARKGLAFGVYLSPWDRNSEYYGRGREYDDYFVHQLEELLTNYGPIFAVWFDGACGEGPNGKVQYYDWERYYEVIRRLQPDANISVCGPDVRWCGNEAGYTRKSEWSVVPARTKDTEKIAEKSQQADDTAFRARKIRAQDEDLGSREVLADETDFIWYPAEVNTSIRPGWFYHDFEDEKVKSLDELVYVYEHSVGGNATFLLNIPPTPGGRFHDNDVKRLKKLGDYLRKEYAENRLADCGTEIYCDGIRLADSALETLRTDSYDAYLMPEDGVAALSLTIRFREEKPLRHIVLKENIRLSQRIEAFAVYSKSGCEEEKLLFEGTTVGYKRIVTVDEQKVKEIRIDIRDARVAPTLAFIGVY